MTLVINFKVLPSAYFTTLCCFGTNSQISSQNRTYKHNSLKSEREKEYQLSNIKIKVDSQLQIVFQLSLYSTQHILTNKI